MCASAHCVAQLRQQSAAASWAASGSAVARGELQPSHLDCTLLRMKAAIRTVASHDGEPRVSSICVEKP
jgi:hypothetical protein